MKSSVAIVTRRADERCERLAERLAELIDEDSEVLVVAEDPRVFEPAPREQSAAGSWLVRVPERRGLGYNRNRAVDAALGDVIVFVDDDCWPDDRWFAELLAPLQDDSVDAVMGAVRIPPSTLLGDSISALGFPGGGSLGFAVMFEVDHECFTRHISTLNCALRRRVFERVGGFDETMTAGGEDGELSHRIAEAGLRVKYQPSAIVEHEARTDLIEFSRWFFRRGRAAYQFSRRAPMGRTVQGRLASYRRIIEMHARDARLFLILPLLGASVLLQQAGFVWELATARDRRAG